MSSSHVVRRAAHVTSRLCASLWTGGFAVAGRLSRSRVAPWSSPGGLRVLVVAPHPDDETLGCGGTLALHARCGDDVLVTFATDGRRSGAFGLSPDEMARRRRGEAEDACAALGVRSAWIGLPEGEWVPDVMRAQLGALLVEHRPDVIYAPSRIDFHPEHLGVAAALGAALADHRSLAPRVRVYGSQVPLTSALATHVAPVGEVAEKLQQALDAYVTQAGNVDRARRQRGYAAAYHRVASPAEEFWEVSAAGYTTLHGQNAAERFRSLRSRPWTDPLAYVVGRGARRRLRGGLPGPGR